MSINQGKNINEDTNINVTNSDELSGDFCDDDLHFCLHPEESRVVELGEIIEYRELETSS